MTIVPPTTSINAQSRGAAITANVVIKGRRVISAVHVLVIKSSRPVVHAMGRGAHKVYAPPDRSASTLRFRLEIFDCREVD
jgi:hypothetical protein